MLPVVLLLGALVGRWWCVPVLALGWAVVVWTDGTCTGSCAPGALGLAAANAAVGVAVRLALSQLGRRRTA